MKNHSLLGTLILLVALLFTGCYSATLSPIVSQFEESKSYTVGERKTATIGIPILESRAGSFLPRFKTRKELVFRKWTIRPNTIFDVERSYSGDCKEGIYAATGSPLKESNLAIIVDEDGRVLCDDPIVALRPLKKGEVNQGPYGAGTYKVEDSEGVKDLFIKIGEVPQPDTDSFSHELLYSGVSDNTLFLSYREYSNDMARPAFTQDLKYNLKESKVIAFKDYKIEVHKATNSSIEYTILKD